MFTLGISAVTLGFIVGSLGVFIDRLFHKNLRHLFQ